MAPNDPRAATLLSGGAAGSEHAFARCALRWGLSQETYSFKGRPVQHREGLILLDDDALMAGEVRNSRLKALRDKLYPSALRDVLRTIWHQVATSDAVFVVGQVRSDQTVKGGTGWAVELAKQAKKPVHVFDQECGHWVEWSADAWAPADSPVIGVTRFTGTGTRCLEQAGERAIEALFERSFGPGH